MTRRFYGLLVLNILHVIGLAYLLFIFYGKSNAIAALIICSLFGYIAIQYAVKVKGNNKPIKISQKIAISDYVMDSIFKYCNIVVFVGIILVVVIYEF